MYSLIKFFLFFIITFITFKSFAHSGGLNSAGCHNNNKTGGYHCHRSSNNNSLATNFVCKIIIGDQYYEFNPLSNNQSKIKFNDNNGEVEINCFKK